MALGLFVSSVSLIGTWWALASAGLCLVLFIRGSSRDRRWIARLLGNSSSLAAAPTPAEQPVNPSQRSAQNGKATPLKKSVRDRLSKIDSVDINYGLMLFTGALLVAGILMAWLGWSWTPLGLGTVAGGIFVLLAVWEGYISFYVSRKMILQEFQDLLEEDGIAWFITVVIPLTAAALAAWILIMTWGIALVVDGHHSGHDWYYMAKPYSTIALPAYYVAIFGLGITVAAFAVAFLWFTVEDLAGALWRKLRKKSTPSTDPEPKPTTPPVKRKR